MTFFLESSRLKFRHWTEDDLPLALSLWGDPEVAFYLGGALTEEQCAAKLRVEMDQQAQSGVQYWPVFERATGEFVGASGLRPYHDETGVLELGVHIGRPFWSGRFGEEAARAVIGHAFDVFPLDALVAGHNPDNNHSQALLARLGFLYTHDEPWEPAQPHAPLLPLGARTMVRTRLTRTIY